MHSLGTLLVTLQSPEIALFDISANAGVSKYTNRISESLFESWKIANENSESAAPADFVHYTSHSQRHGSAETSNEHPDIQTQWLIPRGM